MKTPSSPPLVDPAVIYFGGFVLVVTAIVVLGDLFFAKPAPMARHHHFPSEQELHDAVRIGQTEDDVIAEMGDPSEHGPLQDGLEVLDYFQPANKVPDNDTKVYAGFAVYLSNGKVVDVQAIRGSDLRN